MKDLFKYMIVLKENFEVGFYIPEGWCIVDTKLDLIIVELYIGYDVLEAPCIKTEVDSDNILEGFNYLSEKNKAVYTNWWPETINNLRENTI